MRHSIDLEGLSADQRRSFDELGIGPGDRVYVRKLNKLSDDALAAAAAEHGWHLQNDPKIPQALARRFARVRRTIVRRLRGLPAMGATKSSAPDASSAA